jgi:hypothetical protein
LIGTGDTGFKKNKKIKAGDRDYPEQIKAEPPPDDKVG